MNRQIVNTAEVIDYSSEPAVRYLSNTVVIDVETEPTPSVRRPAHLPKGVCLREPYECLRPYRLCRCDRCGRCCICKCCHIRDRKR